MYSSHTHKPRTRNVSYQLMNVKFSVPAYIVSVYVTRRPTSYINTLVVVARRKTQLKSSVYV